MNNWDWLLEYKASIFLLWQEVMVFMSICESGYMTEQK